MRTFKQYFPVKSGVTDCSAGWGLQAAEVFKLVVEHCKSANTAATVCSLIQVNAACSAALQQVRGQCEVKMYYNYSQTPPVFMQRIRSFSCWLPKYAGLVSDVGFGDEKIYAPGATRVLFAALSSCTSAPAAAGTGATAAAAGAAVAAAPSAAGPLQLQLNSFDAHCDPTSSFLHTLAATGLQKFTIFVPLHRVTAPFCNALGSVTSLQELKLIGSDEALPRSMIAALRDLMGSSLSVCIAAPDIMVLPPVLRALTVEVFASEEDGEGSEEGDDTALLADIRGLTNLTHLKWHQDECEIHDGRRYNVVLPSCLNELLVQGHIVIEGSCGVSQLQVACNSAPTLSVLKCLACMHAPFGLLLLLSADTEAPDQKVYASALRRAAQLVSSCTSLARVSIISTTILPAPSAPPAPWCGALAQLSGLQELSLCSHPAHRSELLQLSCLTGLTRLQSSCEFDDHLAMSVLSCLVGLSDLSLSCSQLQTMGVLSAVSRLTQLTSLVTCDWGAVDMKDGQLQHFHPLKQLRVLDWLPMRTCSKSAIAALCAELPVLTTLVATSWA